MNIIKFIIVCDNFVIILNYKAWIIHIDIIKYPFRIPNSQVYMTA